MKKSARKILNSAPVVTYLSDPCNYADNKLMEAMDELGFGRLLTHSKFRKQKGDSIITVVYALLIWPLLDIRSISSFCGRLISVFIKGGAHVLYRFQRRENLQWRKLRMKTAKQVYLKNNLANESDKAFVFDDTLKQRRGKKVEGSSKHYNHVNNRYIHGHQNLELGLVSNKGYLPVDSQLFIGEKRTVLKEKPFKNSDSALSRDYDCALKASKNEMFRQMLKRAIKLGIKANYVLGDAWFGNKGNIRATIRENLTAIFRMKNGNLKYRLSGFNLTADQLFHAVKHFRKPDQMSEKLPWKTYSIVVEINLTEKPNQKDQYIPVKLVFSIPKNPNRGEFAIFLCTDTSLSSQKILELYALRWGIEVYFKEVKQYMGFLKEQSGNYAFHYASVHLAAIRYLLFSHMFMQDSKIRFGDNRKTVMKQLEMMSFASLLWTLFKALIYGALDHFKETLGAKLLESIKDQINKTVLEYLTRALQLDPESLLQETRAEQAGVLG